MPWSPLGKAINDIGSAVNAESKTGLRWSDRSSNVPYYPLTDAYKWLGIDVIVYTILLCYFDGLWPSDGARRPVYYFLQPSFWCPKVCSAVQLVVTIQCFLFHRFHFYIALLID